MKVVTARQMQDIDRKTIEEYGLSGAVLMERAGLAVAKRARELGGHKIIVLCGTGNNGGDGLVAARDLHNSGYNVRVLIMGKGGKAPDCLAQYKIAQKMGVRIENRVEIKGSDLHSSIVIDAIFGTGLSKDITGPIAETINRVNNSGVPVLSVDIPSGVSSDTAEVMGTAIRAAQTVTFGLPKRGHLLYPGAEYAGELFVEDIGFPAALLNDEKLRCNLIEASDAASLIPARPDYSHKGDYGHVLIIAGSRGKTGAALMSARACLRAGAGLVTIGIPEHLTGSLQSQAVEEMLLPLPDTGEGALSHKALDKILSFLESADIVAIGPGLGRSEETARLVRELVSVCAAPMVIDADAINAFEDHTGILEGAKAPIILTPHPGEFSRLTGLGKDEIEKDRIGSASAFSEKTGAYVVLKGAPTVIADPEGDVFINPTGNPGMAKAGSGDVLTGVLSSFLSQGLNPMEASILGAYMHGLAGDLELCERGLHSMLASDIIEALPSAFESLQKVSESYNNNSGD